MQRLFLDDYLDPRVVVTSFGWWFPERSGDKFVWDKSNINILTRSEAPYDAAIGTTDCVAYLAASACSRRQEALTQILGTIPTSDAGSMSRCHRVRGNGDEKWIATGLFGTRAVQPDQLHPGAQPRAR